MKSYRKEELRNYAIGNVLFIIVLSGLFDSLFKNDLKNSFDLIHMLFESAILSSILYIYIFVIDSMIPASIKDVVSFIPIKKPGTVVFSYIRSKKTGYKDDRFSWNEIENKYKDIYKEIDKKERKISCESDKKRIKELKKELRTFENTKWFDIYRNHAADEAISNTQKDFLLNRDMNILTISILIFYLLISLLTNLLPFQWSIIILIIAEFLATSIAVKSKAIRFVLTVISRDIHPGT